ncbi:helix-turn-helix domain-containing protein [Thaumasiovibrio subtropicus]|uniref:helix-turn-helix domain-containing protein n=1 Tax=Thaumasiovibrio subtropicus TaxID=1891207 RepID=UPI000B361AFD|nr:AraC family transcriptional regulator [Thaumasiovibrio subtropicus]
MPNKLSIRAYTKEMRSHHHQYHQLVLPLHGAIDIAIEHYQGIATPGDCVVIRAGQKHTFSADENARFIVADMHTLPDNLHLDEMAVFSVTPPLLAYLHFIERQLGHQHDLALETQAFALFFQLLATQQKARRADQRIEPVLAHIMADVSAPFSIDNLAKLACLSPTQFKKRFKSHTGSTPIQYITSHRMEKARALLMHSDLPVALIAEQVGYQDPSAFSRRFLKHFGQNPTAFQPK